MKHIISKRSCHIRVVSWATERLKTLGNYEILWKSLKCSHLMVNYEILWKSLKCSHLMVEYSASHSPSKQCVLKANINNRRIQHRNNAVDGFLRIASKNSADNWLLDFDFLEDFLNYWKNKWVSFLNKIFLLFFFYCTMISSLSEMCLR